MSLPLVELVKQECLRLSDLPLLSSIVQRNRLDAPLKNYAVLNIQHQLGDVTGQAEALIELGAHRSDLYFLPPASTHYTVFEDFVHVHFGVPRENFFPSFYQLRHDDETYRLVQVISHLNRLMQMRVTKSSDRLLVLDDGGCFSEALATLFDIEGGTTDVHRSVRCSTTVGILLEDRHSSGRINSAWTLQIR